MVDYVNGHVDELKVKSPDGVQELVVELKKKNFVLGLVTGNLKEIARVKLEKIGLWGYFEIGGFGEVSDVRSELVEEALKQVKSAFERENVFYIGDTPLDIECGKEAGVNTIVVATKRFSFEELQKHNPDLILKNLSDYQQILNLVGD